MRYERLIVSALRDVPAQPDRHGSSVRQELGPGVRSWPLRLSRAHAGAQRAARPRHVLIDKIEPDLLVVRQRLHDAMDLARHREADKGW